MSAPAGYVALDGLSTVLTLAVAVGFLYVARWSRQGLHYLLALGFMLVAAGFLFVSVSQFSGGQDADAVDAARILLQLTGAFLLLLAYAIYHATRRSQPLLVLAGAVTATAAVGLAFWLLPPTGTLPHLPAYVAAAYAVMAVAYLGCAFLSGYGWHKRPTWGRAMVPLGFLCWTFSMYTWIFITLGGMDEFLPVVYGWRFSAILLMLWAMARRPRFPATRLADAPA